MGRKRSLTCFTNFFAFYSPSLLTHWHLKHLHVCKKWLCFRCGWFSDTLCLMHHLMAHAKLNPTSVTQIRFMKNLPSTTFREVEFQLHPAVPEIFLLQGSNLYLLLLISNMTSPNKNRFNVFRRFHLVILLFSFLYLNFQLKTKMF